MQLPSGRRFFMNHALKIFTACAIGAMLGAMVAIDVHPTLWWLGLIVGFGTGYLSYEIREVVFATRTAWRLTTEWRPNREWWRIWFRIVLAGLNFSGIIFIPFVLLSATCYLLDKSSRDFVYMVIGFGIIAMFPAITTTGMTFLETLENLVSIRECGRLFLFCPNCFALYFRIVPARLAAFASQAPEGLKLLRRFGWNFLILIHSEIRLLCGIDAAIGAGVGYYYRSVLFGMLFGGLFGVLNYKIMSKRVLKAIPTRR